MTTSGTMPNKEQLLAAIEEMHGCGTEALDAYLDEIDVIDYEEFLAAFSQAKFGEIKSEAELNKWLDDWLDAPNIPLSKEKAARLMEAISSSIDGSSSWNTAHNTLKYTILLKGEVSEKILKVLDMDDFASYIYPSEGVANHSISPFQYITVAVEWCQNKIKELLDNKDESNWVQTFDWMKHFYWNISENFAQDAVAFIQRHPEYRTALWKSYFENDDVITDIYEPIFLEEALVAEFSEEIKANAKMIYALWVENDFAEGYEAYGPVVTQLFKDAGAIDAVKADASLADAKQKVEEAEARIETFRPKCPGISREEFAEKMQQAMAGQPDETGAVNVIRSLSLPEKSTRRLMGYTVERVLSPTSPAGTKLLEATTGTEVEQIIRGIFNKGRWNSFDLDAGTSVQESVEQADTDRPVIDAPEFECVLINGTLTQGTEAEAKETVEACGATWSEELGGEVSVIVQGSKPFFTADALSDHAVQLITEEEFWSSFKPAQ